MFIFTEFRKKNWTLHRLLIYLIFVVSEPLFSVEDKRRIFEKCAGLSFPYNYKCIRKVINMTCALDPKCSPIWPLCVIKIRPIDSEKGIFVLKSIYLFLHFGYIFCNCHLNFSLLFRQRRSDFEYTQEKKFL